MELTNGKLKVTTKPAGAELTSIKFNDMEYLWQGDSKYWSRQAPILFPIVGKLKEDKTVIEGKEYVMHQHGFGRDSNFEEIIESPSKVTYLLTYNGETLKVYPYKFQLYVSYELTDNAVAVTYKVKNIDDKTIFFSIGGHPAFRWPLLSEEKFEDYYIEFNEKEIAKQIIINSGLIEYSEEILLNNENIIKLSKEVFDVDTLIFKGLKSNKVSLKSMKGNHSVSLCFPKFPYLGIWSKRSEAEFICLEPWFGVADSVNGNQVFNEKNGIQKLATGENFECRYTIEIA